MSSCLIRGGSRAYAFDLEILKSPSTSTWNSHSSSPSSTLSESTNSPRTISTRKPRAPRKRLNQSYNEAATLLSTACPNIFPTKHLTKPFEFTEPKNPLFFNEPSELLFLPFRVIDDSCFLLHHPPIQEKPGFRIEPRVVKCENPCPVSVENDFRVDSLSLGDGYQEEFDAESILDVEVEEGIESFMPTHEKPNFRIEKRVVNCEKACQNPVENDSQLGFLSLCDGNQEDFDAESMMEEGIEEGIDSIMGNVSVENDPMEGNSIWCGHPMGLGIGGKFDFGVWMGKGVGALRHVDDRDWWGFPSVNVLDISPKLNKVSTEKKKKKVEKQVEKNSSESPKEDSIPKLTPKLLLKLNYEEVLNAWSDRGMPFSEKIPLNNLHAKMGQIDLFSESASRELREASVLRYNEKRCTRLVSDQKVDADQRPISKGRFVRRPNPPME